VFQHKVYQFTFAVFGMKCNLPSQKKRDGLVFLFNLAHIPAFKRWYRIIY